MMFDYLSQFVIHFVLFPPLFPHKALHQINQDLQLTAGVKHEDRSEAARACHNGDRDESCQALNYENRLVNGTDLHVEGKEVTRTRQRSYRNVLIGDDFAVGQRQNRAKSEGAAIHEESADHDQTFPRSRGLQHDVSRVRAEDVLPILLDVLQASSELIVTKYKNTVLTGRHKVVEKKRNRV